MSSIQLNINKRYTFADYLTWLDGTKRELIDGFIKIMSPSPLRIHQDVSRRLTLIIGNYLKDEKCRLYYSPSDVRLANNNETCDDKIYTVVQPDIFVVCDLNKLDEKGCLGAPDFIIEIVSKRNSKHDVETKFNLYEKHGVKEYWIVHPHEHSVTVFLLEDKKYKFKGIYAPDSKVKINIFENLYIDLSQIFLE